MRINTFSKVFAGIVATAAAFYGILMVISLLPHQAVQTNHAHDRLSEFGPRSGPLVAYSAPSNSIFVAGELTPITENKLKQALLDHPGSRYLVLRSRGVDQGGAERIRDVVRESGITTLVVDYCYGSCASIFMSGQARFLSKRAAPLMLGLPASTGDFGDLEREMDRVAKEPGPSLKMTEEIAGEYTAAIRRPVEVKIVSSPRDFADAEWLREAAGRVAIGGYRLPIGYFRFDNGKFLVRVVSGVHVSPNDVRETLAHEIFGHAALAHWSKDGGNVPRLLAEFAMRRPDLIEERAKVYGFSPAEKTAAAEEALSRIAETQPRLSALDAALASHRAWLRAHFIPDLYLSDREVIWGYIMPLRRSMVGDFRYWEDSEHLF